jgi:type II secretory pathway component GspD/PulD (secretin)
MLLIVAFGLAAATVVAQDGRPTAEPATPATPQGEAADAVEPLADQGPDVEAIVPIVLNPDGRRPDRGDKVVLAFDDVPIQDTIPFIVETTGKVVMPVNLAQLKAKKITLINDAPIDRMMALDLLIEAFRLNDIGVIEHPDRIIIGMLSEIQRDNPTVVGPNEDIMARTDRGTIITKIFAVTSTDAGELAEQLRDPLPDHASLAVDTNSNQIIVLGDVGLCQRLGTLIKELDRNYMTVKTTTYRLAHADANEIAQNILDLFEDTGTTGGAATPQRTNRSAQQRRGVSQRRATPQRTAGTTSGGNPGPTAELRITVNVQQNAVTVSGEPDVVEEIGALIATEWDLPRPQTTKKVYHLKYTDPLKMRNMLAELLGGGSGGAGGAARTSRRGTAGGAGQRADVSASIGGIYQIQAYPDSNSLVVLCKTEESFMFLDSLIMDLDQPVFPGVPIVVELKHAEAEEVADQINAIFAPAGARVDLRRRDTGLQGIDIGSPTDTGGSGPAREGDEGGTITFPWQQGRQSEDETPESPLIGKVRVVPIHRQNAVMILAAPEYREAVRDIIVYQLDKPGRQVLIAAIIAEVELTDDLALGLRVSNSDTIFRGTSVDNRVGVSLGFEGLINNIFGGLFDTSTLTATSSINLVLQALAQKTKVRILQEPVIFTADNQEASFFEGQDVPVLVSSQLTPQGTVNESTEYQAVGIGLNVRPRITSYGDVDMEINLEISNINVAASVVAVSPVFDRRETTTQVIVKDGQTIVISGILRDQESKVKRKVPLLGDIPLIGALFTSIDNQQTRTELIAFVTPFIVDSPDENDTNFNEVARERLLELSKPLDEQGVGSDDLEEKVKSRLLLERYKHFFERDESGQRPERN